MTAQRPPVLTAALFLACGTVASAQSLVTPFNGATMGGGTWQGLFFNLTALDPTGITVERWDIQSNEDVGTPLMVRIWAKPGTYVGSHNVPLAWDLLGEYQTVAAGVGNPTPVELGGLYIPSGQLYGVRVGVRRLDGLNTTQLYSDEFFPGFAASMSSTELKLDRGAAQNTIWGSIISNRGWNGGIHYSRGNTAILGRCCLPDGVCHELPIWKCVARGGTYGGDHTLCAGSPCPQPPTGACCREGATCSVVWEGACASAGGLYRGDGTDCTTACPSTLDTVYAAATLELTNVDSGAFFDVTAIDPAGIVIDGFQFNTMVPVGINVDVEIMYKGGSHVGFETDLGAWTRLGQVRTASHGAGQRTPVPIGGLHIPGGETYAIRFGVLTGGFRIGTNSLPETYANSAVQITTKTIQAGYFSPPSTFARRFSGTVFYSVGATVATGACCRPNGTCFIASEAVCADQNGEFKGDATVCGAGTCPQGACCLSDGSCLIMREVLCDTLEGVYWGNNSACGSVVCQQPGACCFSDLTCQVLGEAQCAALGGNYNGNSTACASCPPLPEGFFIWTGELAVEDGSGIRDCGAPSFVTFNVTDSRTVDDVALALYMPHPWQGDVRVLLRHVESGRVATLIPEPGYGVYPTPNFGFSTSNFGTSSAIPVRFADSAADGPYQNPPVPAPGINSVSGDWKPYTPLSIFNGMQAQGTWQLEVRDCHWFYTGEVRYARLELDLAGTPCYANCDQSTTAPVLNVADFTCFLQRFAGGDAYANCDNSTNAPVLNVADFTCFLQKFAAGCP